MRDIHEESNAENPVRVVINLKKDSLKLGDGMINSTDLVG